jgi:hypothetical protein
VSSLLSRCARFTVLACSSLSVVAASCIGRVEPTPTSVLRDNPAECVQPLTTEVIAWTDQVDRLIDDASADLAQCWGESPPGESVLLALHLDFGPDGKALRQIVLGGSAQACAVKECIKDRFARLHASAPPGGGEAAHNVSLRLESGSMRRVAMTADQMPLLDRACREFMHQGLETRQLEAVLRTQDNELEQCERTARSRNPVLKGNVFVQFTVGDDGIVYNARARSTTLSDCALVACLVEGHRKMRFPPSRDGSSHVVAHVNYRY